MLSPFQSRQQVIEWLTDDRCDLKEPSKKRSEEVPAKESQQELPGQTSKHSVEPPSTLAAIELYLDEFDLEQQGVVVPNVKPKTDIGATLGATVGAAL